MESTRRSTSPTRASRRKQREWWRLDTLFAQALPATSKKPGRKSAKKSRQTPVTTSRNSPPVLSRSFSAEAPAIERRPARKMRKRYDVAIGSSGVEMRLPSMPAVRFSKRWLLLLVVILIGGGVYFAWNAAFFKVTTADVQGAIRIPSEVINTVLNVSGKPIFTIKPNELSQTLAESFPEFSTVKVSISLPNQVVVSVVERKPVLTWRQADQVKLVDAQGYSFPLRLEAASVISPLIEASGPPPGLLVTSQSDLDWLNSQIQDSEQAETAGKDGEAVKNKVVGAQPFLTPEMVAAILATSPQVPAGASLAYDPRHGLGWQDPQGWQVFLGDAQQMDLKLSIYNAIRDRLANEGIQPTLISVEHVHRPYYRLEP